MTCTVEFRPAALEDLLEIARYIAQDNPRRAAEFVDYLEAQTLSLADQPAKGRPGRVAHTRELVLHPNYVAIYRHLPRKRLVEIIRVKHAAQA